MSERSSIFRNSIFAIGATGVRGLGAIGVALIVANGFSASEFGEFRFFQLTVLVMTAVAAPGMVAVATKFFAKAQTATEKEMPPIAQLWILSTLLSLLVAAVCLLLPGPVINLPGMQTNMLFAAIVFAVSANFLPMGALIGRSLFFHALLVELASISVLVLAALYALWSDSLIVVFWGLLFSAMLALVLNSGIALYAVGTLTVHRSLEGTSVAGALNRIAMTFGPMSLVGIFIAATFWTVGWITRVSNDDPVIFALYSIGMQWFVLANTVPDVVGRVIFPKVVQAADQSMQQRQNLLWLSIYAALGSSVIVALISLVCSPIIMPLYGAQYAKETLLIGAYAAAAIPFGIANMIAYSIIANDGERLVAMASLLQLLVAALGAYLLISFGGLAGALALFLGSLLALMFVVIVAKKQDLLSGLSSVSFRV